MAMTGMMVSAMSAPRGPWWSAIRPRTVDSDIANRRGLLQPHGHLLRESPIGLSVVVDTVHGPGAAGQGPQDAAVRLIHEPAQLRVVLARIAFSPKQPRSAASMGGSKRVTSTQ